MNSREPTPFAHDVRGVTGVAPIRDPPAISKSEMSDTCDYIQYKTRPLNKQTAPSYRCSSSVPASKPGLR